MRRDDGIRDHSGRRIVILDGCKQTGPAEFFRKVSVRPLLWILDKPIELFTAIVIQQVQFAGIVFAERDQLQRRIGQFPMPDDFVCLAVITQPPNLAGLVVLSKPTPPYATLRCNLAN